MLKIKLNKKVNPKKTNKMLYAVAAGLGIVLTVFFALSIGSGGRKPADTLAYLKRTEGLIEVRIVDGEKKALIVFNSDSKNAGNFEKIAYYAAIRLSRHWPDCRVLLARNNAAQVVYVVRVNNGTIAAAGPVTAGTDRL
jgi:hypothetical protein